jgi:hypothetical protein
VTAATRTGDHRRRALGVAAALILAVGLQSGPVLPAQAQAQSEPIGSDGLGSDGLGSDGLGSNGLGSNGLSWTLAFDHIVPLPYIDRSDDQGASQPIYATGRYVVVHFRVRNNRSEEETLTGSEMPSLEDVQGRRYDSDYVVRQPLPYGHSSSLGSLNIAPGATASFSRVFDVAKDATGLRMLIPDGNSIAVG